MFKCCICLDTFEKNNNSCPRCEQFICVKCMLKTIKLLCECRVPYLPKTIYDENSGYIFSHMCPICRNFQNMSQEQICNLIDLSGDNISIHYVRCTCLNINTITISKTDNILKIETTNQNTS